MRILSKYFVTAIIDKKDIKNLPVYSVKLEDDYVGYNITSKYGTSEIISIEKFAINRGHQKGDIIGIMIDESKLKEGDDINWV